MSPAVAESTSPAIVPDNGLIVAALFALIVDWDSAEVRNGRRGDYRTTGASMVRIRELKPEEAEVLKVVSGVLGMDHDEEDLADIFSGDFEYQVSYACNRFATARGGQGQRLTQQELRTLERASLILKNKEAVATEYMTMPRKAA